MPPHAFEALDSRISTTHGLCCVEPPGQDGYNCLLLAAIDQLRLLVATADIGTEALRTLVREFLSKLTRMRIAAQVRASRACAPPR